MTRAFSHLAKPLTIGAVTLKNRFAMAPMDTGFEIAPDGSFSDEGIDYFARRAEGGFALLFCGGLNTDNRVEALRLGPSLLDDPEAFVASGRLMNKCLRAYGCEMFPQLSFGLGRNVPGLLAPSELPVLGRTGLTSPAMTTDQVYERIAEMVEAARIVRRAGFLGVDVHALHWGHLMDEFGMAITNRRDDEFGGMLENRYRVARLVVEGIKEACGQNFAVTMRLGVKSYLAGLNRASFDDADEAGRTLEEAVEVARMLEAWGYDALSIDTGTCDSMYWACPPSYVPRGYMDGMAARVKAAVSIPVIVASRMGTPQACEAAVAEGKYDAVALGRPSLADPDLPNKVFAGHPEQVRPCLGCNQGCIHGYAVSGRVGCAVNPEVGHECGAAPVPTARRVAVVGGGVAGMEAALAARARGAEVTLFEATDHLGGNLVPAGAHEFKREVQDLCWWYARRVAESGIRVRYRTKATADDILATGTDAAILAVGSVPVMPRSIAGIDHPKALSSIDAIAREDELGQRVAVVGGGLVGCELALDLAQKGREVTVVEALPHLLSASAGGGVPAMNRAYLLDAFSHFGVRVLTGTSLAEVSDEGAVVEDVGTHERTLLEADSVVVAVGFRPLASLADELRKRGLDVWEVGDGRSVGNIMTAVHEARAAANEL